MNRSLALIIDDETDILELIEITLSRMGIDCICSTNLQDARQLLDTHQFNICLTDMKLPDGNGIEFVAYAQERFPHLPIAVITAHGSIDLAVRSLKSGAFDFLSKPIDLHRLRALIKTALTPSPKISPSSERRFIGSSKIITNICQTIRKLSRSQAPVYISGESGVGKELVARMLHEQGPRADRAFVAVNCGAIPSELLESELFGYKKGSFTGADADKTGLFQMAEGGTLFFDEIADLPQYMQVKLLRAIQEKCIRPIGATEEISVDVRLLSAAHQDLDSLVQQGLFRKDLYYRINVIELHIPPLRERTEDIPDLVDYILDERIHHDGNPARLSAEALEALTQYDFLGNIRELENILERAITLCEGSVIELDDLYLPEPSVELTQPVKGQALHAYLDDVEKQTILGALEKTRWNRTAAAKLLGISFRALRYRLEKLSLDKK